MNVCLSCSCFDRLESKLSEGRARLVGCTTTLADYVWAVNVHHSLMAGFPVDDYPHVMMWFDIIKGAETFKRAVIYQETGWMVNFMSVKVSKCTFIYCVI